jgi:hypothetical protein
MYDEIMAVPAAHRSGDGRRTRDLLSAFASPYVPHIIRIGVCRREYVRRSQRQTGRCGTSRWRRGAGSSWNRFTSPPVRDGRPARAGFPAELALQHNSRDSAAERHRRLLERLDSHVRQAQTG